MTQYYSTETVLLIFPFLQINITVQMRPSGGWWGVECSTSIGDANYCGMRIRCIVDSVTLWFYHPSEQLNYIQVIGLQQTKRLQIAAMMVDMM